MKLEWVRLNKSLFSNNHNKTCSSRQLFDRTEQQARN